MKRLACMMAAVAAVVFSPLAARADAPGAHPAYLHALSDLRSVRWLIEHRPGDLHVSEDEKHAITRIDAAMDDIRQASIDDGKNVNEHMPMDERPNQKGRLHEAQELLQKVRSDVARQEDDSTTRGLRDRAVHHIDEALQATHQAIVDAERGH